MIVPQTGGNQNPNVLNFVVHEFINLIVSWLTATLTRVGSNFSQLMEARSKQSWILEQSAGDFVHGSIVFNVRKITTYFSDFSLHSDSEFLRRYDFEL